MATPLTLIALGALVVFVLNVVTGADLIAVGGLLMLVGALVFVGMLFVDFFKGLLRPTTR